MTLKDKRKCNPHDIKRGYYPEEDVAEAVNNSLRRIKEVINMEWNKGMEYVLNEIEEIFKEEFGDFK